MVNGTKSFYHTQNWLKLLQRLKTERLSEDGILYCEYCHKPILKQYDCIGHHKKELNSSNVNDYNISLNPDNVMLVHHACHNKIHERFGNSRQKKVYLVYGAPCSGKSTWVKNSAGTEDIIFDIDNIWQMITNNERYVKPNNLRTNVFMIRDCIFDMIRMRTGRWKNAYVVGGYPLASDRERLIQSLDAEVIFIDEKKEVCLERAKAEKRIGWDKYIEEWFADYC